MFATQVRHIGAFRRSAVAEQADPSPSHRSGQHKLTLLANSTGDWTKALNKEAAIHQGTSEKQAFGIGRAVRISVEGAWAVPTLWVAWLTSGLYRTIWR